MIDTTNPDRSSENAADGAAEAAFDFDRHRLAAIDAYWKTRDVFVRFAQVIFEVLTASLGTSGIVYHEIQHRAKDVNSFGTKAAKPLESNPLTPKYPDPMSQITDLAAARVITFLPKARTDVDNCIAREFVVLERTDKSEELGEDSFGYTSIHYIVQMKPDRLALPEYQQFRGLKAEIQCRTILEHAWAEMEHDIQYKSATAAPKPIRRRFGALAGMLEIADREFQAIQDEDQRLREEARTSIQAGRLEQVEITPDSIEQFLDNLLGVDGRMSKWSYEFLARNLRRMGFANLDQVRQCVEGFDDDRVCRAAWGTRQGQITRFETLLRAGMGPNYGRGHSWEGEQWWTDQRERVLSRLRDGGIAVRSYMPPPAASEQLD